MSIFKKPTKSKFMTENLNDSENLLDDHEFSNDSPQNRNVKQKIKTEKDFHNLSEFKQTTVKQKNNEGIDDCGESRQRTLNVMNRHLQARKVVDDNLMKDLTEAITNVERDHDALKDNVQKLEQLTMCFMKCIQQAAAAHKEKLKAFKGIFATFKKEAEGLILRGAVKQDDRPLWFDVYKAFPPTVEPKFARPKPENPTIKPILYKEDVIRAKFHGKGHGLSVNMLTSTGETQTRKLVQKYQQLQSEGVPEEELLQKSVEAVGSTRQAPTETTKMTAKNTDSVTAQVLAEADLKNIFKE